MNPEDLPDGGLIHYVGTTLRIGSLVRERCAWCGALIYELDMSRVAVQTSELKSGQTTEDLFLDEDGNPRAHWRGLVWVAESGGDESVRSRVMHAVDPQEVIPEKSCMNLDPEMTR